MARLFEWTEFASDGAFKRSWFWDTASGELIRGPWLQVSRWDRRYIIDPLTKRRSKRPRKAPRRLIAEI